LVIDSVVANQVNVLKPSHKSSLKSKIMGASAVPDSFSAVNNATTRDIESEIKVSQEGKVEGKADRIITTLKSEKEEVEASLNKEKIQTLQLKEELAEIDTRNTELYKELQSVRNQLAAEQSRCFKLEVEVAELRQKLQTMETLQKELELLQRQRAVASEQAATMNAKRQSSGGVWGWLAGTPPPKT
jgi:chromosome segregation ATPase